jgi:chromosome segregation ATPase
MLPYHPQQKRPMPVAESPTDLKQLPLYALLAYAARCARRVSVLFRLEPGHAEAEACTAAVDAAIRITEALAAAGEVDPDDLAAAEEGTVRAVIVASEMLPPDERAAYAANSAYAAICAARAALEASVADDVDEPAGRVADAATIARDSAVSADDRVERAARLDWEMLYRMFLGKFPGFGEPVDAAETGMLGALFQDAPRNSRAATEPVAEGGTAVRERPKSSSAGKAKPRKEPEQHVLDEESQSREQELREQQSRTATELEQQTETLKRQQDQLRQDAEQAAVDRAKLLAEVDALKAQVEADRKQLAVEREEHTRLCESHKQKVERIEAEQHVCRAEAGELEATRGMIEAQLREAAAATETAQAAQQQLDKDRTQISKEWENLKVHVEELAAERERLNAALRDFEIERDAIKKESDRVREIDANIADRERHATEAIAGLHAARERFDAESTERAAALAARETALVDQETALNAAQDEHATTHADLLRQIDIEKTQLREFFESLQNERREFLEERLRWKP